MSSDRPVKRRHVWVNASGGFQYPGLIIAWRNTDESGWEAYVAMKHGDDGSALITWQPAATLRPVTDDRKQPPAPRPRV